MTIASVLRVTDSELTLEQAQAVSARLAAPAWAGDREIDSVCAPEPGWLIDKGHLDPVEGVEIEVERYARLARDRSIDAVGPVTVRLDWLSTPASMEPVSVGEGFDVQLRDIPRIIAALQRVVEVISE
jgi:hypothetical protein